MATTTTNFGWDIPQSTDLVKDGATAIAALGQDIDTAFVDLKGGSTGQVLAKASNTDLDYSWVTTDDTNAIQNAIVDAKGDLISATANDTPARLAVGNNGEVLVADSTTSTGLRYQGSITSGKNFLINGGFDIWQRGTSFSVSAFNFPYTADRWTTFNGAAMTISQETTTVPTGANYALKVTGGAATAGYEFFQGIESLNAIRLANKAVVASILATGTTGVTHSLTIEYSTSVDPNAATGSWTGVGTAGTASVTSGTFSSLKATATIPSTAKSIRIKVTTGSLTSGQTAIFGNAQLELGSVPTEFSRAGSTIGGELALCQRYFQKSYDITVNPGTSAANGYIYSNLLSVANNSPYLSNPIKSMRTPPTVTVYGYSGTAGTVSEASNGVDKAANTGQASAIGTEGFIVRNGNATTQTFTQGSIYQYTASAEL
jgi:hypothetical protein